MWGGGTGNKTWSVLHLQCPLLVLIEDRETLNEWEVRRDGLELFIADGSQCMVAGWDTVHGSRMSNSSSI